MMPDLFRSSMSAIVIGLGCTLHFARADSETFTKHVVAAGGAADAGRDVRRGGNAIDASIAILAVTLPRRGTWAEAAISSPTWRIGMKS